MTRKEYIQEFDYISNSDFRRAKEISQTLEINIQDWKLPLHQLLTEFNIRLMIMLRLHLEYNCKETFKNNFYDIGVLDKQKGVYAVNYNGHVIKYNGYKFFGHYKNCILDKFKDIVVDRNEKLYFIDGSYPVYSVKSCLKEDIEKVKATNYSWFKSETIPLEIKPYRKI